MAVITTIRLPSDLHEALTRLHLDSIAAGDRRSLNSIIIDAVREYLAAKAQEGE